MEPLVRLIVNADDFGRSGSHNAAIVEAHQRGVLTTASLMVNEPGAEEAVALARQNPKLGVGLHLTLLCGHCSLGPQEIPSLVGPKGAFSDSPVKVGVSYFFRRSLREELRAEIRAQLRRFASFELPLDHINGHLNIHLHPTILRLLMEETDRISTRSIRLTRDWFWENVRIAGGAWGYRCSHALIFLGLTLWARPRLRRAGWRHTEAVFGLLQNGRVDERYLLSLLRGLPAGNYELYSHPSLVEAKAEFEALVSPRVGQLVKERKIQLIRYQDL